MHAFERNGSWFSAVYNLAEHLSSERFSVRVLAAPRSRILIAIEHHAGRVGSNRGYRQIRHFNHGRIACLFHGDGDRERKFVRAKAHARRKQPRIAADFRNLVDRVPFLTGQAIPVQ